MNTDLMFSSKSDAWATPQKFFDELDEEFHFTLDVAASKENAKCARYYTVEDDGLTASWGSTTNPEVVWCNPPYARRITGLWVKKGYESSRGGLRSLCSCQRVLIHRIFISSSTGKLKSASSKGDSSSEMGKTRPPSPQWS